MAGLSRPGNRDAGASGQGHATKDYVVFATVPCAIALPAHTISSVQRGSDDAGDVPLPRLERLLGMSSSALQDGSATRVVSLMGGSEQVCMVVPRELRILQATPHDLLPLPRLPELASFTALLMLANHPHALVLDIDQLRAMAQLPTDSTNSSA